MKRYALLLTLAGCDPGAETAAPACDDAPLVEQRLHAYDAAGRLVETRVVRDGADDHAWRYEHDEAGRRVRRELHAGDAIVRSEVRVFDAAGRLLSETHGGDLGIWEQRWRYDDAGRPIESVKRGVTVGGDANRYAKPLDFEPVEDPITATAPQGVRMDLWLGPEEAQEERLVVTYKAAGDAEPDAPAGWSLFARRLRTGDTRQDDIDGDLDGDFELRTVTRFDAAGAVVHERMFQREPAERLVSETVVEGRRRTEARFDELGELAHGALTLFDARGERLLREEDRDGDGVVDWRKAFEVDAAGRRVAELRDADGDGLADRRWRYTWTAGQLTREDGLVARDGAELCD